MPTVGPVWWRAERIGAISGFLTIAGLLGNLVFTRNAPESDQPIAKIASELAAHENAYLATAAFDAVQVFFFLVFAAALASLARRADEDVIPNHELHQGVRAVERHAVFAGSPVFMNARTRRQASSHSPLCSLKVRSKNECGAPGYVWM